MAGASRGRQPAHVGVVLVLVAVVLASPSPAAQAGHDRDRHSENVQLLANSPKPDTTSSDLAFWGALAFAGNYGGFRILDISSPRSPRVLVDFACPGEQNDVSVWEDLLFVSVDEPLTKPTCDGVEATLTTGPDSFEGIRIFDVGDPARPRLVTAVATRCGSHTHTLVPAPDRGRAYLYVSSSAGAVPTPGCSLPHAQISVVEVPLESPAEARVVSEPEIVAPLTGCHDIQVFLPLGLAAAACLTEGQIWDISDPVRPRVERRIYNPAVNVWHSAAFTWDGRIVAFGDELGGAAVTAGCETGSAPLGAIWLYRVADPVVPVGYFSLPRGQGIETCTAHNFNVVPVPDRYLLVSAFYAGGTAVVDFSDPAAPRQVGFYDAEEPVRADTWSSYWYNGHIYASDTRRGLDVLALDDPASGAAARLERMNPQTQEALPAAAAPRAAALPVAAAPPARPDGAAELPATGGGGPGLPGGGALLVLTGGLASLARRSRRSVQSPEPTPPGRRAASTLP